MKKSSKILGSVALSAALVMGTAAPAFADAWPGDYSDVPEQKNAMTVDVKDGKGSGTIKDATSSNTDAQGSSTVVTVSTYTSQIDVTVPLYLPIWLDTAGSKAVVPSDGTYYIENRSPVPVSITKAEYKNTGDAKINFADHNSTTLGQNEFWIGLTPKDMKAFYMEDDAANKGVASMGLDWKIPEKGKLADDNKTLLSKLTLPVSAASGKINHAISDAKLATITYTVGVAADTKTPGVGDGTGAATEPGSTDVTVPTKANLTGKTIDEITTTLTGLNVTFLDASDDSVITDTTTLTGAVTVSDIYKTYTDGAASNKMNNGGSLSNGANIYIALSLS